MRSDYVLPVMAVCSVTFQLLSFVKQCADISFETISQVRYVTAPSQKDRNVLDGDAETSKHHRYQKSLKLIELRKISHFTWNCKNRSKECSVLKVKEIFHELYLKRE